MIFPVQLQAESQEYSFPMGCESLNIAHGCLRSEISGHSMRREPIK